MLTLSSLPNDAFFFAHFFFIDLRVLLFVVLDAPDGGLQHLFELRRQWRDGYGFGLL
jgi:hypothetical protein